MASHPLAVVHAHSPLGAPRAGKGTLSKRLARDNSFTHISIGDLLRENVEKSPAIAWHVKNGELLPSDFLIPLLRERFLDCQPGCPIIVDGFPRRSDQIQAFEKAVSDCIWHG
jgi:adenylate kinase family enzyme